MQINSEMLIKTARNFVAKRLRQQNDIVAVYLTGSVTSEEPCWEAQPTLTWSLFTKITQSEPGVRVTYEISLDIEHHHQSFYTYHRRLRQNPWIGFLYAITTIFCTIQTIGLSLFRRESAPNSISPKIFMPDL